MSNRFMRALAFPDKVEPVHDHSHSATDLDREAIRARVLHAISANRNPGLHFAGHFLDVEWRKLEGDTASIAFRDGPHCRDADGTVNIAATAALADWCREHDRRFRIR